MNREIMDKRKKDWSDKSDQIEEIQKIARLVDEDNEPENKYSTLKSKEDFLKNHLQNFKHDLQSPLGGILGMLDLLIDEDKDQVEVQTRDLMMIKKTTQALLDLVNDTFVVRDAQKSSDRESIDIDRKLSSAMKEIHRLYLPMAQSKRILLLLRNRIDKEIELQPNLFLNLIQITGNLIANAIKFTPSNGSFDVVFTLDTEEDRSMLLMTVVDSGKGMTRDQVSAFNQGKPVARSMGTNREQGSGIGLLHVK